MGLNTKCPVHGDAHPDFLCPSRKEVNTTEGLVICDGCNVQGVWEHRCHGMYAEVRGERVGRPCQCPECSAMEDDAAPARSFVVRTRNSTYRFGPPDDKKIREVVRIEEPLDFTRCRVWWLRVGYSMRLECFGVSHPNWYTTKVLSIEPLE